VRQLGCFLFPAVLSNITAHYVNAGGVCVGHVVSFSKQRDRSKGCGEKEIKNELGTNNVSANQRFANSTLWVLIYVDINRLVTSGTIQG
jgi:hypothetical protein